MSLVHLISHLPVSIHVRFPKQTQSRLSRMENSPKLGDKKQRWQVYRTISLHASFFIPTWTKHFQTRSKTLLNYPHNIRIVDNPRVMFVDNFQVAYAVKFLKVSVGGHLAMFRRRIYHQYFQTSLDRHLREDSLLGSDHQHKPGRVTVYVLFCTGCHHCVLYRTSTPGFHFLYLLHQLYTQRVMYWLSFTSRFRLISVQVQYSTWGLLKFLSVVSFATDISNSNIPCLVCDTTESVIVMVFRCILL